MLIKVTQEHIDKGVRFSGSRCPIALAINDSKLHNCIVDQIRITFIQSTFWATIGLRAYQYEVPTPKEVLDFISRFDGNVKVEPFEFELAI